MFSSNKKLNLNLKNCMNLKPYNNYRILIKYKRFQDSIIKRILSHKGEVICNIKNCNLISARLNSRGIKRLLEYPEIDYICFDEYLLLCGTSVKTANKVRLSSKTNAKGSGVGIAIIDTGVYPHSDLINPINRISTFVDLINDIKFPYDDHGHGTCTAGIIAGNGEKSKGMYSGIAPECNIHCYKAFDKSGKGFISDILYAMELITDQSAKYNIKVLCLPFELLQYNVFLQKCFSSMVSYANSKNITCIIPSGSNKNLDGSITGLALCNNCITVSGYDSTSKIKPYTYSSAGDLKKDSKPNLCAACVDIVSLNSNTNYISEKNGIKQYPQKLDSSYKTFSGTSLAAAYVTGICALIYGDKQNITPKDIASLLRVSCESLDMPKNLQGDGKININNIIK